MADQKNLRKSLKGPDKFQKSVSGSLSWLYKHRVLIGSLTGIMLVIMFALIGYQFYYESQADKRGHALAKVEKVYQDETQEIDKQRQAINKEISQLRKDLEKKENGSKKNQIEEKITALEKQQKELKADHSESLKQFESFFEKYKNYPEGWVAGMRAVSILLGQANYAQARDTLTKILSKSKDSRFYQLQGRLVLVNVLEEMKEYDQALTHTEILLKQASEELKPKVLLAKSRILMQKNDREQARSTLDELISKHSESPEARKAQNMKSLLLN